MIVDSTPTAHGPPSNIPSILPSMSSIMSAMHVGLGRPEVLPDGAAMGTSAAAMTARVMGWFGQRTPTVSNPPVVRSGTMGFRGKIIVSGPGQNFSASAYASGGTFSQYRSSHELSGTWIMSGLSCGRPLARKMRSTASSFSASAPRP